MITSMKYCTHVIVRLRNLCLNEPALDRNCLPCGLTTLASHDTHGSVITQQHFHVPARLLVDDLESQNTHPWQMMHMVCCGNSFDLDVSEPASAFSGVWAHPQARGLVYMTLQMRLAQHPVRRHISVLACMQSCGLVLMSTCFANATLSLSVAS